MLVEADRIVAGGKHFAFQSVFALKNPVVRRCERGLRRCLVQQFPTSPDL